MKLNQAAPIATVDELANYDAIIFGTPTRFGNMCAQMRNFLDQTGGLWMKGALVGKVGSVFASTGTQHGGQETTITSFHSTLLHQGMIIVGLPYAFPGLTNMNEISGGTPYGATTLANADGSRQPSANELDGARYQGKHGGRAITGAGAPSGRTRGGGLKIEPGRNCRKRGSDRRRHCRVGSCWPLSPQSVLSPPCWNRRARSHATVESDRKWP